MSNNVIKALASPSHRHTRFKLATYMHTHTYIKKKINMCMHVCMYLGINVQVCTSTSAIRYLWHAQLTIIIQNWNICVPGEAEEYGGVKKVKLECTIFFFLILLLKLMSWGQDLTPEAYSETESLVEQKLVVVMHHANGPGRLSNWKLAKHPHGFRCKMSQIHTIN